MESMLPVEIPNWGWMVGGILLGWLTALPIAALGSQRLRIKLAVLTEKLDQENRRVAETQNLLNQAERRLKEAFEALSKDALAQNNSQFLQLADRTFKQLAEQLQQKAEDELEKRQRAVEALVKPISDSLDKVKAAVGEVEKARIDAYAALKQQLDDLLKTHLPRLHKETEGLVRALHQPAARGRWGEVQLRRVVEMAGMVAYCDFEEQVSREQGSGRLRPDLIVHLPGRRSVVVDAKVPLEAYLKAVEGENDSERQRYLADHASQLKRHIQQLSQKSYFEQFERAPEFVVLFIPGEAFFSAALRADPSLIEYGVEHKVIPASPTTLIALLKAVAYGWQQEKMAQSAEEIIQLGKELHDRIIKVSEHWVKTGAQLEKAVKSYNEATRSLETRLLPTARKFQELRQSDEVPIAALDPIEQPVYQLSPLDGPEGARGL